MSLSVTTSSIGQTSFTAKVSTSGSVAMEHWWYIDGVKKKEVYTGTGTSSSSCTFTGLAPGTSYSIRVEVYSINPWKLLDSGYATVKTEDAPMVAETYYAKLILDGNGGKTPSGYSTYEKFTGWGTSWSGGADVNIDFYDPGFKRTGYVLTGWSTSSSSSNASYNPSDSISIYSTKTSENNPATKTLYAVWSSNRPDNWEWWSTVSKGSTLALTAAEWNAFIQRIKDFAVYKGVTLNSTNLSTAAATKGSDMMAYQAKAVRSLVNQLSPPTSVPTEVSSGDTITAEFVNGLKNALNSIR